MKIRYARGLRTVHLEMVLLPGMKTVRIFSDRIRDRIRLEGFRSVRIRVRIFNIRYGICIRILKSYICDVDIQSYLIRHDWYYPYSNPNPTKNMKTNIILVISDRTQSVFIPTRPIARVGRLKAATSERCVRVLQHRYGHVQGCPLVMSCAYPAPGPGLGPSRVVCTSSSAAVHASGVAPRYLLFARTARCTVTTFGVYVHTYRRRGCRWCVVVGLHARTHSRAQHGHACICSQHVYSSLRTWALKQGPGPVSECAGECTTPTHYVLLVRASALAGLASALALSTLYCLCYASLNV